MNASGSAVVEVMRQASLNSWKKWRDHVAAGTSHTAEAVAAFDDAQLAGQAWLAEIDARQVATEIDGLFKSRPEWCPHSPQGWTASPAGCFCHECDHSVPAEQVAFVDGATRAA